ncbi:hypothetical protein QFC19_005150 [Naganishia cerealis]|uniref:Uncharacterized protein n=1 Tax=Naganishia cerealis TaxID=610337 RepID=A0ACC2VQ84_9TREE|nr:hypothetical protein QFC19_005150 [Naganishia cerealis]
MAIKASADKLIREMASFGEDFSGYSPAVSASSRELEVTRGQNAPADRAKSKKGKVTAKSTGLRYQFQILELYTVFSPQDDQPCMDHDRACGEGVVPVLRTAIKLKLLQWPQALHANVRKAVSNKQVFLIATTSRPELVYGQTNCFIGAAIDYGIYQVSSSDCFILGEHAARNMAYQNLFRRQGELCKLADIGGKELIGSIISAPFSHLSQLYVVPLAGMSNTQGTGIACCVPSSSPHDYAALEGLRRKPGHYSVNPEWISHDPIPLINTDAYGNLTAVALVNALNMDSVNDRYELAELEASATKEERTSGTMLVGDCAGLPVKSSIPLCNQQLINAGMAFPYAEPEQKVLSRSGDECVVALCDQWYLDYGNGEWKAKAKLMNTFIPQLQHSFEAVLDWLNQWSFARSYCLGSKLPWDPQLVVESLSDSTIYMAYYTVAHLLQGGSIYGNQVGPLKITADQMTDEVWSYVLQDGAFPAGQSIDRDKAAKLRSNFRYWYPMDIRSSGKDLISNHLAFCVYNHAALFEEEYWPRAMRANGHLLLGGQKMSKSTGNFLTLQEALEKFGADATRLVLADAGDDMTDANFDEATANACVLRLYTAIRWATDMKVARSEGKLRSGTWNTHDQAFMTEMEDLNRKTRQAFIATFFKDCLKYGYYEYQSARDWYRDITLTEHGGQGMHVDLVFYFIRTSALLAQPFIPHYAEYIWREILDESTSVQNALWPEVKAPFESSGVLAKLAYIRDVLSRLRSTETSAAKKRSKGGNITYDPSKARSARIIVATKYPEWKNHAVAILRKAYDDKANCVDNEKLMTDLSAADMMTQKEVMPFVSMMRRKLESTGVAALSHNLLYSEIDALTNLSPYIKSSLKLKQVIILTVDDALTYLGKRTSADVEDGWERRVIERAEPERPGISFWNC